MKEHYNLTDEQLEKLASIGIGISSLFHMAKEFSAGQTDLAPVSKISILIYIDKHGDFTELKSDSDKVAFEVFQNLNPFDKRDVLKYIEHNVDE